MKVLSSPYAEFKAKDWYSITKKNSVVSVIDNSSLRKYCLKNSNKKVKRKFFNKIHTQDFIQLSFA